MNIIKKLICIMYIIVILFTFSSCKKDNLNPVGESPIQMHNIASNSHDDYVTFNFDVPENWMAITIPYETTGIMALDKNRIDIIDKNYNDYSFLASNTIVIKNQSSMPLMSFTTDIFEELFNGNTKPYEDMMNEYFEATNRLFNKDILKIVDFNYKYYTGKHGKIVRSDITEMKNNQEFTEIRFFRSDIPEYVLIAMENDDSPLSSGDIALWVMDSLEITEHFKLKDGNIQKEDE